MAQTNKAMSVSWPAAEDLSSSGRIGVVLNSDGKVEAVDNTADKAYGILQNSPVADEAASVIPIGPGGSSKIALAEVVAIGAEVSLNASGKGVAAASGAYTIGLCEVGGNTDDMGTVLLNNLTIKA